MASVRKCSRAASVATIALCAMASVWSQTGREAMQVTPLAPPPETAPRETIQPQNPESEIQEPPAPLLTPLSETGLQTPAPSQSEISPVTPLSTPPADTPNTNTEPYPLMVPPPSQAFDPAVSLQSPKPDAAVSESSKITAETSSLFKVETFVLDPGHGGIDPGVTAPDGTREKEITLALAQAIGQILLSEGRRVLFTRSDDRAMRASQRAATARDQRNAVLLSLHVGRCAGDQEETGITLVRHSGSAESQTDAPQAKAGGFIEKLETVLKDKGYTVRTLIAPLRLQRAADVPVILIECGCLENNAGRKMLTDESARHTLVRSLAEAITAAATP